MNETCKLLEVKYSVKPNPMTNKNSKKSFDEKKKNISSLNHPQKENANEYRELAHEYFQVRQTYFEKASEAHSRGWGAVAQFYAEMVKFDLN